MPDMVKTLPAVIVVLLLTTLVTAESEALRAEGEHRDSPRKRIALTFDDAPRGRGPVYSGEERGAALIETLRRAETGPVAFFVTTQHVPKPGGRERIERYAAAGHLIANHTHTHPWLHRTDTDAYIAGIDRAEALLEGIPNRRPWFRFPFLDEGTPLEKRDAVRAALRERDLINGYVTVDNYDWYLEQQWSEAAEEGRSVDLDALQGVYVDLLMDAVAFYDRIAVDTLGRSPVHVLLLHENDVAALFVDDLVAALRDAGWSIVSPDLAYADPVASMVPKTLKTRQGHIGGLAVDAGLDPRTLTHWSFEEAEIDTVLERRSVFGPLPVESYERLTEP